MHAHVHAQGAGTAAHYRKHILSQTDVYLDKSNCDKVTLQQQQSMEVIYLPHRAISALSSDGRRENDREERWGGWLACVSSL